MNYGHSKRQTLETLSDGGARDINKVTLLEELLKDEPLVRLETLHRLEPELLEMAQGNGSGLLQVTKLGLGELLVPNPAVTHLDGVVSVGRLGLDLRHNVSLSETHDRDGHDLAVILEVTHHPQLGGHHSGAGLHTHDHESRPLLVLSVAQNKKARRASPRRQWRWGEEGRRK